MSLRVVIPPAAPLLTAADVRAQLGFGPEIADAKLDGLVAAATAVIDGPDGWLGRAIRPWTLELGLVRFPVREDGLDLPCPPVTSVQSVTYVDVVGADQALDPALWLLDAGMLYPAYGHAWPVARSGPAAVRIRYAAGYAVNAVPAPILQAVVLQVAALNAMLRADPSLASDNVVGVHSQSWAHADIGEIYDKAASRLLGPYRIFA